MKQHAFIITKVTFWFTVGATIGLFFSLSFLYILFQKAYDQKIYPGITIGGTPVSGKTQQEIKQIFAEKNAILSHVTIEFSLGDQKVATIAASDLHAGYNGDLLSDQAYTLGRSQYFLSNVSLVSRAYFNGLNLPNSYHYDEDALRTSLATVSAQVKKDPVDALFTFENGKVTQFRPSVDGADINWTSLDAEISDALIPMVTSGQAHPISLEIPVIIVKPHVGTSAVNNYGIKELVAEGTSLFAHSIPGRVHNIQVATSKLNGVLIAPHETFSFDKTVGEISQATGYDQAYVISQGRTVLGDGGGVCQVSTTLFRAALNAGLPIVERHEHDYRVGYYEQDGPPGIDAAINVPAVDLKFTNDSDTWLLIQASVDVNTDKLTFDLYGTKDGRTVTMTAPVISGETPAPPTLYQDDPTLPKGQLKQVDFAANGAHVQFDRTVMKAGSVLYQDTFKSNYQPWQAIYLRGTGA